MNDRFNIVREAVPNKYEKLHQQRLTANQRYIPSNLKVESLTALGWLPALSLVMALGIALVAIGCSGSRMSTNWAQLAFWIGLLTLFVPPAIRLCMKDTQRRERLVIVLMIAVGYYLIKVFYSPLIYTLNDELQHWRSMNNILQTQQLFQDNPSLQVSAYFPGLEIVTDAVITMSGLSIFQAGFVVIGMVYITIPISLFLLFERVSHSSYIAGIASLLYFANPSMLLGYSQFAYESLAVPLAFLTVYMLTLRVQRPTRFKSMSLNVAILLSLSTVIITHHVTSYMLTGVISLWALIATFRRHPDEKRLPLVMFAIMAIAGCILWLYVTGNPQLVIGYIDAPIIRAINSVVGIFTGRSSPRSFFSGQGANAAPTPLWMQIPSYISVVQISFSILLGLLVIIRTSKVHSLAIAFGLLSLGYYVAQATRVSASGLVMTDRIGSIIFFPLCFVVALGITLEVRSIRPPSVKRLWRPFATICVCLIIFGTATAVIADRELPGRYKPNIFTRDINTLGIATAHWTKETLGPSHRVGADFINMLIMGSYGDQQVVTEENGFFAETTVFASEQLDPAEIGYLKGKGVEYLVIDNNLENKLVIQPQPPAVIYHTTLDGITDASRIYDSGSITIYHLGFVSQPITVNPNRPASH